MNADDHRPLIQRINTLQEQLLNEKKRCEALLEEGQLYQTIWNHSLAGMYLIQDGIYQLVSPIAASYMGYGIPELVGMKSAGIIHPEDRKKARNDAIDMLAGRLDRPYSFRIIAKTGDVRWVIETVTSTTYRGKPAILGNAMDITARKLTEEKLKESENFYRTLFETTGTATMILENDMTVSLVNAEFEKMTGYKKSEWEGKKKWMEMVAVEDIPKMQKYHQLRRINPDAVPKNYEFKLVDSEKKLRDILITVDLIPGTDKSVCSDIDLTELKAAERRLKESERFYRTLFETTGNATIIIEDDMTISLINSEFEKLTGFKKEDWEGKKKWTELVAGKEDLERLKNYHRLRRKSPERVPRNYEYRMRDNRGRIRNIYCTVDMIPGTRKSFSSFTDITEIRDAEQELSRKSKKLEDMNTALTVLLNKRSEDLEEIENRIFSNVKELVLPHIEQMKLCFPDPRYLGLVELIEANLREIVSPFANKLSAQYASLTPKEIQIANFIKEGKTSKEIAQILHLSKSAIDVHRYRLRKKVGLNRIKTNLRNHLAALK
ncbi:MAG: PAS domain S-box protein [Smithellaceae bacterium]|nr:PAS domain S-box protein [Syntrophaceae bacterium]MDD4241036.1 PAS domain S-box protein [Smithellaceae bacterium]